MTVTYQQTLDYLYAQLPMYHRVGAAAYKADLTNTIALCEYLGNPHRKFRSVHVGGTNGKGSVSHLLAALCQGLGLKTGLYISPHYKDFRERIKINGQYIPRQQVVNFIGQHRSRIEEIQPSFFELTVGMAFDYFAAEQVDIAIIEVGLGGRLDSTNIITPLLSIITNISYDHMNMLGDTLPLIAAEKAGIIKSDIPVVIGETHPESAPVFLQKALEVGAPIVFADAHFRVEVSPPELRSGDSPSSIPELRSGDSPSSIPELRSGDSPSSPPELRSGDSPSSPPELRSGDSPSSTPELRSGGAPSGTSYSEQSSEIQFSSEKNWQSTIYKVFKENNLYLEHLEVEVAGPYQAKNVATTLQAWELLKPLLGTSNFSRLRPDQTSNFELVNFSRLRSLTRFMGRWQVIGQHPTVLCDSAHNEAGIRLVFEAINTYLSSADQQVNLHVVTGFVNDKDVDKALELFPAAARYYFAKADIPRGLDAQVLREKAAVHGLNGRVYTSVRNALRAARRAAAPEDLVVVIGSIFVVAEVLP